MKYKTIYIHSQGTEASCYHRVDGVPENVVEALGYIFDVLDGDYSDVSVMLSDEPIKQWNRREPLRRHWEDMTK